MASARYLGQRVRRRGAFATHVDTMANVRCTGPSIRRRCACAQCKGTLWPASDALIASSKE
eukprot:3371613-Alexandrium_andersonii.AAC.1